MITRLHRIWASLPLRTKGLVVVAIPLLPLVVTTGILSRGDRRVEAAQDAQTRVFETRDQLEAALTLLIDADTAVRGYLLTGRPDQLDPYWRAQRTLPVALARLDALTAAEPVIHGPLLALAPVIRQRMRALDRLVRLGPPGAPGEQPDYDRALDRSKALMDEIRARIASLGRLAGRLESERRAQTRAALRDVLEVAAAGGVFGLIGGVIAMLLFTSGVSNRVGLIAAAADSLARGEPAQAVPDQEGDEVGRLGLRLQEAFALLLARDDERRRAHEDFDRFFEVSPVMLCIAGGDGYFRRVNPAWTARLGWTAEELLAVPYADRAHPEDREALLQELSRLLSGRSMQAYEGRYTCRDGSYRWLRWVAFHHRDEQLIYGVVRDVTERRRAVAALRASDARLQAILNNSPAAIYVKDLDGRFVLVNREFERLFGRTQAQLQGLTDEALHDPAEAVRIRRDDLEILRAGRPRELEERVPFADGEHVYMSIKFPLDDGTGAPVALCGISVDITARTHAEESVRTLNHALSLRMADLSVANRELEAFSYSVSHDLRAPLRHVAGFAALLTQTSSDALGEDGRRYVRTIAESADRMGRLIDDLLAFSRMGRVDLRRAVVPLRPLVDDVLAELRADVDGRAVDWTVHAMPSVYADPAMLRQVLLNLVDNALKYTRPRERAEIEIGSRPAEDGFVAVYVADNGVGFDMQYADKLFGVFQRLHRADQFEGTGIGLANVRRIVQRHGGRTWAEGAVDRGACFWVTLPVTEGRA